MNVRSVSDKYFLAKIDVQLKQESFHRYNFSSNYVLQRSENVCSACSKYLFGQYYIRLKQ